MCFISMHCDTAGEPIPPDVEEWYFKVIGKNRCLFLDTWSQTGTYIYTQCNNMLKAKKYFIEFKVHVLFL